MAMEQVVSVRATGDVKEGDIEVIAKEALEEGARHSCLSYLADFREATLRPSVVERFAENVTRNRGYLVKHFDSTEPALHWLAE